MKQMSLKYYVLAEIIFEMYFLR